MAIYQSQRTTARTQYEDFFKPLYDFVRQKMGGIPKRRRNSVAKPVLQAMNKAYDAIMRIEEDPVTGTKNAAQTRYECIVRAQYALKEVEKPLWVYWNIAGDSQESNMKPQLIRQCAHLTQRFNDVLILLRETQTKSSRYDPLTDSEGGLSIRYYTEAEIVNAEFLTKLRDLHRMTHGKCIRLNAVFRDAEAELLLKIIDDAWYSAVQGNQLRLIVPKERELRRKLFSKAIGDLYKSQRLIFSLFSIGSYSNREIKEWVHLLNQSAKLLQAVQNSDKRQP